MEIRAAQQEMRAAYLRGSVGQAVSGLIWLAAAALGTWVSANSAVLALALGGAFIFPLTRLALRLVGSRAAVSKGNPLNMLAMQVAFTVPLLLPVILALTGYAPNWFFPAFMIVVGAHYLPFIFLYGMWAFGVLAALLLGGGVAVRMLAPDSFTLGGWLTGAVLILFALAVRLLPARSASGADPQP